MDILTNHFTDWLILVSLIALAFYTLKIIGNEKTSFRDESYEVQFSNLGLRIPKWWSITEQNDLAIKFERTDTRYDWYARYAFFANHENKTLPQLLEEKLNLEEVEFDIDVVFETDSRVLFRDSAIQEHFQEVIRVEGKATQAMVDRIYYDIYLMRAQKEDGYFVFESKSSVLNGLVEGPYFEESLSELSYASEQSF